MEVTRPPDQSALSGFVDNVWTGVFFGTIPCFFIHLKIIFYSIFSKSSNAAKNILVANISFAAIIFMTAIGIYSIENNFYYFCKSDLACGIRSILIRLGVTIVTFTLTRIVQEARKSLHQNPLYQYITPNRPFATIFLINLISFLLLLPGLFARTFDLEQEKCVKRLFLDSEMADWLSRFVLFLFVILIPFCVLFKEVREIVKFTRNQDGIQDSELGGFVQRKRLDLLQTSFIFISLFIFVTFPCSIIDILDSPAIILPPKVRIIRSGVMSTVFVLSYLTVQAFPIYIFYAYRNSYN